MLQYSIHMNTINITWKTKQNYIIAIKYEFCKYIHILTKESILVQLQLDMWMTNVMFLSLYDTSNDWKNNIQIQPQRNVC